MALSVPFTGSGEFVPVHVWSCPVHDDDRLLYAGEDDDGEHGEWCLDCEAGVWRDQKDEAGNVVMRELSVWEHGFRTMAATDGMLAATSEFIFKPNLNAKIEWLEDQFLPVVQS